jgi:hypothetical protein
MTPKNPHILRLLFHASLISIVLVLVIVGCQTLSGTKLKQASPEEILVMFQPYFSSCTPSDGSANFMASWPGGQLSSIEMVWNGKAPRQWDFQWNSVAGNTLFDLSRHGGPVTSTIESIHTVSLTPEDKITIDGYETPLTDLEAICLASGHLPQAWLSHLYVIDGPSSSVPVQKFSGEISHRLIEITLKQKSKVQLEGDLSLRWGGFLGLGRHEATIKIVHDNTRTQVDFEGPRQYKAKWWMDHESN